ncbi:hypothetical protein HGA88_05350 [Candidatus Roizmanbacteria bacterium]|nr:hypothetical protein [Candidatus Roizmanbacteria bacterium]
MKKIIFNILIICCFSLSVIQTHAVDNLPTCFQHGVGDVDCDEKISLRDFERLRQAEYCDQSTEWTDLNFDGKTNDNDINIWKLSYSQSESNRRNKVLLLIDNNDALQLTMQLSEMQIDVSRVLKKTIEIVPLDNAPMYSPERIRQILVSKCNLDKNGCQDIEGAIFVGDIPYALYDMSYDNDNTAPFQFYYEDLDSTYLIKPNGHYNGYSIQGLHSGPEIYVSWIKPLSIANTKNGQPSLTNIPYITQLKYYFDKHHRYFSDQISTSPFMISMIHCPSALEMVQPMIPIYGKDNVLALSPSDQCDQLESYYPALFSNFEKLPELAYIHTHGNRTDIWSKSKDITGADILQRTGLPLLTFSWGCQNGNFLEYESTSLGLSIINGKDLGLTFIGKLDNTDISEVQDALWFTNSQTDFFILFSQGQTAGEAMFNMMNSYTNRFIQNYSTHPETVKVVNLYKISGPLQRIILGSPFVFSKTARARSF